MSAFEVLLVTVEWQSENKCRSIIPSKKFLKPSSVKDNNYEYDVVSYTRNEGYYYQICIKTSCTPFLRNNDGRWLPPNQLFNISDDLWIIKGDWRIGKRGIGYHHCPSVNTEGRIYIGFSDLHKSHYFITIDINNSIPDFDFDQLKNDFDGELWNLLTSNKTHVVTERIEYRYANKTIHFPENKLIIDFIKAFDAVSQTPKVELTPSKGIRKIGKVIPIAETYKKISIEGISRFLPSKEVTEVHDVFENRFVCFMLANINSILSRNVKYTTLQIGKLEQEILDLDNKIVLLNDPDPRVNQTEIQNEIRSQKEVYMRFFENWAERINDFLLGYRSNSEMFRKRIFEVMKRYNSTQYWGYFLDEQGRSEYCLLRFAKNCDMIFKDKIGQRVSLECDYTLIGPAENYNEYSVIAIAANGIKLLYTNLIENQLINYNILLNNDWRQFKIFTANEKNKFIRERNNQVQTLKRKKQKLEFQISNLKEFVEEQRQLLPIANQRMNLPFFKSTKWRNIQGFKPSMTFIQNNNYRDAFRTYKEILSSEGINIEIFGLYENITSYGMREMPQVYELWCLVNIIKILRENYNFVPSPDHIEKLLKAVDPQKLKITEHVQIEFKNIFAGRRAILHYQKEMLNGKRPDFVLEISTASRKINVVLDSKFKNYSYKKSIIFESLSIMNKYDDTNNSIFILHPCKDGTFENRNIRYTNHGGEPIWIKEGEGQRRLFPFHKYGYIEVKPSHTDTLKKLIAMSFEFLVEPTYSADRGYGRIDPKPENPLFCINCGCTNISIEAKTRGDNRSYYNCTCSDPNCGHISNIDYCWYCKTRLFKHGSYWDYHLESKWSTFDIHCPNCGMTVSDRNRTL